MNNGLTNEERQQYRENFREYQDCLNYCSLNESNSQNEKDECIHDIRESYGQDLCAQPIDCPVIRDAKFKKIILLFKEILRFIYCSRKYNGNTLDPFLISMISSIPLGEMNITLEELACVKFPGDNSMVPHFPKNLSEYIILFNDLMDQDDIEGVNIEGWLINLEQRRQNMNSFIKDFQPWTRMLVTFVSKQGHVIPEITKINRYNSFISDVESEYIGLLTELQDKGLMKRDSVISINNLRQGHLIIINHLMRKLPRSGGKKTRKMSKNRKSYTLVKKR